MPHAYRMTSMVLYRAQYHRQHTADSMSLNSLVDCTKTKSQASDLAGIRTQYLSRSSHKKHTTTNSLSRDSCRAVYRWTSDCPFIHIEEQGRLFNRKIHGLGDLH